jgi:hypothetical protein
MLAETNLTPNMQNVGLRRSFSRLGGGSVDRVNAASIGSSPHVIIAWHPGSVLL